MPANLNRRTFLKVSFTAAGALVVGACAAPTAAPAATPTPVPPTLTHTALPSATPAPTATPSPEPPFQPDLFVRIDADGTVTLTIHRAEMGQGVRTALAMVLADELEADWTKVRVAQAPATDEMGSQITGGSGSISGSYGPLRQVGAHARAMLVAAAAQVWGVSTTECVAEQGMVAHTPSGQRLGYGELVAVAQIITLRTQVRLKDAEEFRLIGTSVPRVDDPAIVTGQAVFGLDVRVPGMLYATLARCPVPGGTLAGFDDEAAKAVPGVRQVVEAAGGVAVLADNTWAAIQGREALAVTWDEGDNAVFSSASIRDQMKAQVERAMAGEQAEGLTTLEAVYETPYLAHAPMEPVNCVADVRADGCDIWAPTQNPQDVKLFVERAVRVPTRVHVTLLGGGFGRRLEVDYALEAAAISQAAGAPVQLVWTRADDLQHDFYRQPTYHWLRAGWGTDEQLTLWRHYVAGPGLNGIAYKVGQEVLEDGLAVAYQIPDQATRALLTPVPLPTGPWRAVVNGPNAFANESFLDEVAAALGQDPFAFRLALLPADNPMRAVVELAGTEAGWGTPLPEGHGRGLACHTYHQTAVAMVAEASVEAGVIRVHKVVCALDCGRVIHPDMVAQQMEGCIVFGLTSLLKGEITFEAGRVQQSSFADYPLLQLAEMPVVEVHTVASRRPPLGVGEMGVPPIVPAVLNAVYAATGVRVRRTPSKPEDFAVSAA